MNALAEHFSPHLKELRQRLLVAFAAVGICSSVAYFFSEKLVRFFLTPLFRAYPSLAKLVYTNLTEAFLSYLKVSLLVGIVFSFPVLCYELWMFISPGLRKSERKTALTIVSLATTLFASGVAVAYFVMMPLVLSFLLGFAGEGLEPLPKLDAYLTFVVRTSLAFGLAFEIPFLMVAAVKTGVLEKRYFIKQRKYLYIAILVLSFLLAVGDFIGSILVAMPLLGLYEAGILACRIFPPAAQQPAGEEHSSDN